MISPFTRTHAYMDNTSNTRAPIDTLIVELCVLFVVNMDTLNTFRRVGYTEAIARHYRNANLQYIMRSYAYKSLTLVYDVQLLAIWRIPGRCLQ